MGEHLSYTARVNRVLDHIDAHLAEPLDLRALADIAHFSPWHFHRLFLAFTGETLADYVRRRRLEVAATRLLATPPATALSIALEVGFGSAEVLTRAFKMQFGCTPSAWRRGAWHDWARGHRIALSKNDQAQSNHDQAPGLDSRDDELWPQGRNSSKKGPKMNVELKTLPDVRVAYLRHVGPYGDPGIGRLWQRFDAWGRARALTCACHSMYGLTRDAPDITAADKCRYDACVQVDDAFVPDGDAGVQTLPGGLYACTRFSGEPQAIHSAWMHLCSDWLADSDYQADDRPAVELYGEQVDVDPQTGAFSCWLCMPVRSR